MNKRRRTWFYRSLRIGDGCWPWGGNIDQYGYGTFGNRGAHRVSYEFFIGEVPEGLQLDHVCRNRACCNPWHMEPVTIGENIRRGHAARGTLGGRTGERARAAKRRYAERKRIERGPPLPPHNTLKIHCPQGHPYDDENTYILPSRPTARYCRACRKLSEKKRRFLMKESKPW